MVDAITAQPHEPDPDPDDLRDLAEELAKIPRCQHCGGQHARACPRVRRLTFHPSGVLAEVEFWADGRWPTDNVIWPEQITDDK